MFWLVLVTTLALGQHVELIEVKVETKQGWLRGEERVLSTGMGIVSSFKGIPYAEPPVGPLRFKDPIPHKGWTGVRDATEHGSVCSQFDIIFTEQYIPGSEDCLFLNVYTPKLNPKKPFPVLFYIHGGGFMSGSGNDNEHGPDFLTPHEVILVTINYRLDALGFLSLDNEDVPGNAGLKDQALALKWVKDNIKKFGGDPDNITIMGQSAGSVSVTYHMMSPMSKDLFKRAIALSGTPFTDWAQPFYARERAFKLGKLLGFNTRNDTELLEFLQSVDVKKLTNTKPEIISQEINWYIPTRMYAFVPVAETDFGQERYLVEAAKDSLMNGRVQDKDLLIGYTDEEMMIEIPKASSFIDLYDTYSDLLIPFEIVRQIPPKDIPDLAEMIRKQYFDDKIINNETTAEIISLISDYPYIYSTYRFLNYLPEGKAKKYMYRFSLVSGRNRYSGLGKPFNIHGCAHLDDLRYIFDSKSDAEPVDPQSEEYRLINQVCTLFTNFVKFGNPTPNRSLGVRWAAYDKSNKRYLNIDNPLKIGTNPDAEVNQFWKSLYSRGNVTLS
uniref:Carboxylic ester hydrolase n=1 Tax=Cnaphalocrocis medinalis TaxID=437488 RepID=A0A1U9X1U2_CNAME|nr:carboxylesterase [Cnaphalocrocis medinalis]